MERRDWRCGRQSEYSSLPSCSCRANPLERPAQAGLGPCPCVTWAGGPHVLGHPLSHRKLDLISSFPLGFYFE